MSKKKPLIKKKPFIKKPIPFNRIKDFNPDIFHKYIYPKKDGVLKIYERGKRSWYKRWLYKYIPEFPFIIGYYSRRIYTYRYEELHKEPFISEKFFWIFKYYNGKWYEKSCPRWYFKLIGV